jgi:hypothetical protein
MIASIINSLQHTTRKYFEHSEYPKKPGMYAAFLSKASTLEKFGSGGQLLYIGISKTSLHKRDFNQHFKAGQSGGSTLRSSIGAVLKQKLKLKAIPRGGPNDSKRFENYKFTLGDEEELSKWMIQNVEIGYWVCGDTLDYSVLREYEDAVIRSLHPTLDLDPRTKHLNPLAASLTALRQICKEEAKLFYYPSK